MPVGENTYALTTLSRVKEHGDLTTSRHDAEIVQLINEVSTRVEGFLGRHLLSRTWTHDGTTLPRLNSNGGTKLFLREYPVTSVTTLKTYPTYSALTEGYDEDFLVHNSEGIIELVNGNAFLCGPQIVEITYVAGYKTGLTGGQEWLWGDDEASGELRLAATQQVVWQFHQKQREREGIASRSEAGTTVTYLSQAWLPEVAEVLERHKRSYI